MGILPRLRLTIQWLIRVVVRVEYLTMSQTKIETKDEKANMLTAAEVAARLGIGRETVLIHARAGRLPCERLSSRIIRFDWEKVREAMKKLPK